MNLAIIVRASFASRRRKKWGTLLLHTGVIDGMWKNSKGAGAVSSPWSTRKGGAVNPQLLQGMNFAMAMAPWKLQRLPQSHRPRSKQTLGEVRRPKQK